MKINYEGNRLTISDVSIELFKKIIEAIEEHKANKEREEKTEEWRDLAKEKQKAGLEKVS